MNRWKNRRVGLTCTLLAIAGCNERSSKAAAERKAENFETGHSPDGADKRNPSLPGSGGAHPRDAPGEAPPPPARDAASGSATIRGSPTGNGGARGDDAQRRFRVMPPLSEWDEDGDESLTVDEFIPGLFAWWDANGDRRIDIYEFQSGAATWFENTYAHGTFKAWDADGNGVLSYEEFARRTRRSKIFELWDENGDGRIVGDELTYILYRGWDIDDDEAPDIEAWRTW